MLVRAELRRKPDRLVSMVTYPILPDLEMEGTSVLII